MIPSIDTVFDYIRDDRTDTSINIAYLKSKKQLLAEFEKPIKIYSFLSLRQHYHPLFLYRNLNYPKRERPNKKKNETSTKKAHIFDTLFNKIKRLVNFQGGYPTITKKY